MVARKKENSFLKCEDILRGEGVRKLKVWDECERCFDKGIYPKRAHKYLKPPPTLTKTRANCILTPNFWTRSFVYTGTFLLSVLSSEFYFQREFFRHVKLFLTLRWNGKKSKKPIFDFNCGTLKQIFQF